MNANMVKDDLLLTAAGVEIEAAGKDARPKISVVAYTGRIMRVPGWGDIAIDLAGLEAGGQVPLLADHNASVGSGEIAKPLLSAEKPA